MNQQRKSITPSIPLRRLTCAKSICNKPIPPYLQIWLLRRRDLGINKAFNQMVQIINFTDHLVRGYKAPMYRSSDSRSKTEWARPINSIKTEVMGWWIQNLWFLITSIQLIKYWVFKIKNRSVAMTRKKNSYRKCLWAKRWRPILAQIKLCWIWIWAKC